jgi:MFS family permease
MMGATVMILGVIIQVTSYSGHVPLAQFIVGRVITGVGNGMNTSTIPTYQAECSRTSNRGLLICIEGATIAFGTLIAYWIDFGSSYGSPDLTWRFPIAFQIVFGLFIIFGMMVLPESPRWLFTRERYEEGETVIAALMGKEISHHDVQLQKNIILDSIRA